MTKLEEVAQAILAKVPLGYVMSQHEAMEYARAAVEALKSPSSHVLAMGLRPGDYSYTEAAATKSWNEQIDAILAGPVSS